VQRCNGSAGRLDLPSTRLHDHPAASRHIPGIIALNPVMPLGGTLDDLWPIATAGQEAEVRDRIADRPV
jgi:hypothetical protein